MFTMDLFPLLLGDLCLCRKNTQKHQISNTRSKWSKAGPPRATWWGRPTPPGVGRHGNTCATSPIRGSGQETHSQAHPTVGLKSVQDQRLKRCITWIVDSPCLCQCSNEQSTFIPTLYYTSRGLTPKEEGPLVNGGVGRRPPTSPDGLLPPNRLSFGHMQENTVWSNMVRRFKAVSLVVDPRVVRCSPTDR
jgi:hypothetical protein